MYYRRAVGQHAAKRRSAEVADRLGVTFDAVFCLHLAMHLPMTELRTILAACEGSVRCGGGLIVDAPSVLRRRLVGFHATGWHGSTAFNAAQLADLAGPGWRLVATRGLPRKFPLILAMDAENLYVCMACPTHGGVFT